MNRYLDIFLVFVVIAGAVWTYQIKHQSEQSAKQLSKLRTQIQEQENKINLLQADRAIMTNPQRLESIARTFSSELGLEELKSSQIITISEMPDKRVVVVPESIQVQRDDIDTLIKTGSVPLKVRDDSRKADQ